MAVCIASECKRPQTMNVFYQTAIQFEFRDIINWPVHFRWAHIKWHTFLWHFWRAIQFKAPTKRATRNYKFHSSDASMWKTPAMILPKKQARHRTTISAANLRCHIWSSHAGRSTAQIFDTQNAFYRTVFREDSIDCVGIPFEENVGDLDIVRKSWFDRMRFLGDSPWRGWTGCCVNELKHIHHSARNALTEAITSFDWIRLAYHHWSSETMGCSHKLLAKITSWFNWLVWSDDTAFEVPPCNCSALPLWMGRLLRRVMRTRQVTEMTWTSQRMRTMNCFSFEKKERKNRTKRENAGLSPLLSRNGTHSNAFSSQSAGWLMRDENKR